MKLGIERRVALVTGGHRGTGEVIVRSLLEEGADVWLHAFEEADAVEAAERIGDARPIWGDIASDEGIAGLAGQLDAVEMLVNNYGTAGPGRWGQTSTADWLDMYQRNVLSAARMAELCTPGMKQRGWGRIVNLGTIGSHQPNKIMPHYYAAKGALATLGVSLAKELAGTGITVNTVSPGLIHTAELEAGYRVRAQKKGWGESWEDIEQQIVATDFPNPVGRIATREDVADVVVFLCSERAAFVNGQNLRVDGGAVAYV